MAFNNDELLDYLMAYIDNELDYAETEREKAFNTGEVEGILFMLEVFGCDKIADILDKKYRHIFDEWRGGD